MKPEAVVVSPMKWPASGKELNLASRIAPAKRNRMEAARAKRFSEAEEEKRAIAAGTRMKEPKSHKESSSFPNESWDFVARATNPSRMSAATERRRRSGAHQFPETKRKSAAAEKARLERVTKSLSFRDISIQFENNNKL